MAASRKLQGEIERCLKKVTEGVETFEDIWQKVHNAANANQKEKYEADLKKEIKKLQRLRDQIKSWIASAEIKDKSNLLDYRKLIETQMERFKVVERETKTKAYSKEGLGAAQKLDPAQKEREEICTWLVQAIDSLNLQVDQFESEIESLLAGGKKKRVDKDKQDKIDDLKSKVEKHRYHIKKLETILRMLDNMSIEINQVKKIKDDIEYYIESSQDADFQENEYLYDDIEGIDEVELTGIAVTGSANTDSNGTPTSLTSSPAHASPLLQQQQQSALLPSQTQPPQQQLPQAAPSQPQQPQSHSADTTSSTVLSTEEKKKEKPSPSTPATTTNNTMVVKPTPVRASSAGNVGSSTAVITGTSASACTAVAVAAAATAAAAAGKQQQSTHTSTVVAAPTTPTAVNTNAVSKTSTTGGHHHSYHSHHHHNTSQAANATPTQSSGNFATVAAANAQHHTTTTTASYSNKIAVGHVPNENGLPQYPASSSGNVSTNLTSSSNSGGSGGGSGGGGTGTMPNFSEQHNVSRLSSSPSLSVHSGPSPIPANSTPPHSAEQAAHNTPMKNVAQNQDSTDKVLLEMPHLDGARTNNRETIITEVHIPPLLGVAPLGPVPLTPDQQLNFRMMDAAYTHMPHSADSERLRSYLPRNPCSTPSYYPQTPLANSDTLEYHTKLATDTLFFIFYYSEGTKSQYLAAKALKKQSWRFHTKYMMWFQRHEEPRTINEEYEQGTYIYFDYEKWAQRKKEGFTFEYKYLEDRELT